MGILTFQAAAGGALNLNGPNIAGTVNLTLPSADGTSGQPLQTNGSGTLSFANLAIANGGTGATSFTANQIHYGSFSQSAGLTFDGTNFATTGTATAAKLIPTGTSVTGNGMYLPATNAVGISTNGTNAVYIDASQNVGVGTSSPAGKLGLNGTAYIGNQASTGATGVGKLVGAGGSFYIQSGQNTTSGSAAPIIFTNMEAATEWARIDSSGNLLVGVTSGALHTLSKSYASFYAAQITNTSATSPYSLLLSLSGVSGGTGGGFLTCSDGANRLIITGNGNVANVNNSYGAISDIKLKENIVNATPKLANLMQVRVVNYNLKTELGYDSDKKIGVIAQELEQVFPGMVEETPDKDADNNDLGTTTKSVKYSVFVPMLIKAIQEQQALITQLTDRIAALEAK